MRISDWLAEVSPCAVEDMMQSNVLASITIAQSCLESANGNHAPRNNFFGIKSTIEGTGQLLWTREYVKGKYIDVQAWFRVYPDLEDCIADHSNFLTVHQRYANAGFFAACANLDYRAAARALQSAGYATDPNYATSLINIIEGNGLYLYDKEAFSNMQAITQLQKDVADLKELTKGLIKTPAPEWFTAEFGAHCLDGIVNDLTGDADFWRDVAVNLRLKK